MYHGKTFLAGVHVFRVAYLSGGQVLLEGMSYTRSCLTGVHVLQEYMFYRSTCFIEWHIGVYVL